MNVYSERNKVLATLGFLSYQHYLESDLWKGIRKKVFAAAGGYCTICRRNPATQVHHQSYAREVLLGEAVRPLKAVCRGCHLHGEFRGRQKTTLAICNQRLGFRAHKARKKECRKKQKANRPHRICPVCNRHHRRRKLKCCQCARKERYAANENNLDIISLR